MSNYFMHPLFEYMDFTYLDDAMEFFGFDYVKIAHDEMEDETYEELSQSSFDANFADVWVGVLTGRGGSGWKWAGYWVDECGDEYFMLVMPKHIHAETLYRTMRTMYQQAQPTNPTGKE